MGKVANAANAFESKVLNKERKIQVEAQKKVHDAMFALDRARDNSRRSKNLQYQELLKVRRLKQALTRAVIAQKSTEKAAQAQANHWKRLGRKRESIAIQRLQVLFKKRFAAMARGAQKLAVRAIKAQKRAATDAAKIRYLKSKLKLQARQDKRARHAEMQKLRKDQTRLWTHRVKDAREASMRQEKITKARLRAEQAQGAQIAKRALKNQQLLRKMQLPAQMSTVVNRLQVKNKQRLKALTKQNAQMKARIATLVGKLNSFHKLQVHQEVALQGKERANEKLLGVIKALRHGDLPRDSAPGHE